MKIKRYIEFIKESTEYSRQDIIHWLDGMDIKRYTINEDLSVDVDGDVDILNKELLEIPINFNIVKGCFGCSSNGLTTLKGCPKIVKLGFYSSFNQLSTLEFCPVEVGMNFTCTTNQLTSLKHGPIKVGYNYLCNNNQLTSLEYLPAVKFVNELNCQYNKLNSLNGLYTDIELFKLTCDDFLIGPGLVEIISDNESLFYVHKDGIIKNIKDAPKGFLDNYGYLLEFDYYTKSLK